MVKEYENYEINSLYNYEKITGLFVDNAMNLILEKIPKPDESSKKKALLKAQEDCLSLGLTTVDIAGLNIVDIELIKKLLSAFLN